MVWEYTTHVECAETYCNNLGGYYYVCNYFPGDNYVGEFVQNVNPIYEDDEDEEGRGKGEEWDEDEDDECI